MEPWQIKHIKTNLPALIQLMTCNMDLLLILLSKGILSDFDLEELDAITTKTGKSYELVKKLMMRKAYFELIEALHENGQAEVCKILQRGAMSNKIVKFQTTDVNLSDILTRFNKSVPKTLETLDDDLIKQDGPILVNNRVNPTPEYYIQRMISRSRLVSPDIFQIPEDDVFVVAGVQRYELTALANGMNTDKSSNQTKTLTVQFILLELDSHFDKICSRTNNPVHLIQYSGDNKFSWIKTKGPLDKIRKFVQSELVPMTEEDFIKECMQSNKPICIADSPGMGKSCMLTRMSRSIMDGNPFQIVRFLQFKEFLVKLKQPVTEDSLCNAIAETSSDFKLGRDLVANTLKSEETVSYLFFDGFDEINSYQVPTVRELLKCASKLSQTRIYTATRLHMRQELEDMIGGLGFSMLPFREKEQTKFLVKYWSSVSRGSIKRLEEFACVCLESLRTVIGDQDIAGIPLVCSIIAKIYQDDAAEYSTTHVTKPSLSRTISSIFEMYQLFMNDGFNKLTKLQNNPGTSTDIENLSCIIKAHHRSLSLEELCPEMKGLITPHSVGSSEKLRSFLFVPGVLEPGNESTSFRFKHQTFAEYLVAEFIADAIKLPNIPNLDVPPSGTIYNSHDIAWALLCEDVLATRIKEDSVHLKIWGEVSVTSYEFEKPTVCYFFNALANTSGSFIPKEETILEFEIDLEKMYTAAVVSDRPVIGKLSCEIFKRKVRYLPWPKLFLLAAKYADIEMTRQLVELLQNVSEMLPVDLNYPELQKNQITPLHMAAQRGHYNLFEYLWNNGGFRHSFIKRNKKTSFLLHECVTGSFLEAQEVVNSKLQIINLILSENSERRLPTITEERLPHDDSTPLLQPNIHIELFKCLVSKGAKLTHNNRLSNALHIAAINGNLPVAEFIIAYHPVLVQMSDKDGNTPLHLAALKRTNQHISVQLKLIQAGADIYPANKNGCNPFVNGMKHGKGVLTVIKAIENRYPQFLSAFGGLGLKSLLTNSNLMVFDWDEGLYAVAEYFIQKGAVVRCRKTESPWDLEQVGPNIGQIIQDIEFTNGLVQRLKILGIFNEITEISDKEILFENLKEKQGSYEKLMLSLMMCKQIKPFLILKQCLHADDNDSVWFVTPPPGVLDFIADQEPRVLILKSYNSEYTVARIRDSVHPDVVVHELAEGLKEIESELCVINCHSQTKLKEMISTITSFGTKAICIVNETVTLEQFNENDRKLIRTAYDEVKWADLSGMVRDKLTTPIVECEKKLENCNSFFNVLVGKCFETKMIIPELENDLLEHLRHSFVKLAFLSLMQLAVESKFPNWLSIFKKKEVEFSDLGGSTPQKIDSVLKVDFFIAVLLVNKNFRDYLDMEVFVKFVGSVVFECKNVSTCPTLVNHKICENVNLLLKSSDVHLFKEILDKIDEASLHNLIFSSIKSNYLEILKVIVTFFKSGNCRLKMGSLIMKGNIESVVYLYDVYANSNEGLVVEYSDKLWIPLRLVAHRGDNAILKHIIQYHGYELEPDNSLLIDKQLINMKARIVKRQVNQPGIALGEISHQIIPIIKTRNIRLLYMAIDFGANVCAQDKDGYTVLHWAPKYLTPVQYHELVVYIIHSNKTECFQVLDEWGLTALHRAVFSLEVLPETFELYKSQNVDFNAITDENTSYGNSMLHCAVQGNRSVNMIKKLFECGANAEATDKNGNGLLHDAAEFGNVFAIPLLVSLGCSVKSVNKGQQTPLHRAFHNNKDSLVEVVRLLIKHNSDVNAKDYLGRTPLHYAVELCKSPQVVSAIRFLIANGADVNIQDNKGNTMLLAPLTNRTPCDYHQIVQIIEETSPDSLEIRDNSERTTLHKAVRDLEIQSDTLKLLIKYVGINAVDNKRLPPLFYAIEGGRSWEFIIMIIENGADPQMRNNYQSNTLHRAAMYGNVPALEYFLERGEIGVIEKNEGGDTPLHSAFHEHNGHVHEVVRLLLEAGGDVNVKNHWRRSPLDLAVEGEEKKKVDMKTVTLMKTC